MKKWASIAVLAILAVITRGIVLAVLFGTPVLADIWIAANRDHRYKFRHWPLTRRLSRALFISRPRTETPAIPGIPAQPLGELRTRRPPTREMKQQVWARDGGRCKHCGIGNDDAVRQRGGALQYDHVIPFSRNGADTVSNLQLLCGPCNRAKSNRRSG